MKRQGKNGFKVDFFFPFCYNNNIIFREKEKMEPTYCNPLCIEGIPEGRTLDTTLCRLDPGKFRDYRSISDPGVIFSDGKWIMYPSYAVAYISEDFVHWKHVDIGLHDVDYSPAIAELNGRWYLAGHSRPDLYAADSPLGLFVKIGEFRTVGGETLIPTDCCLFSDEGHLYLYWFTCFDTAGKDVSMLAGTVGAELDPEKPWQLLTEPVKLLEFDPSNEWERFGEKNQNDRCGWIEGPWMIKHHGRYYLLYSGCGTEFGAYANGVCVSDEGPLSGFRRQKNGGLLTEKRTGLVRGAGHGCITVGPDDTLWCFYTNIFNYNFQFERRISMDPLGIDGDGELYCPATTETPQYAPGVWKHPENGNDAGLLPLTFMTRPTASSASEGRDALYASDDSVLTWWQPEKDDKAPQITFDFGSGQDYDVSALRLIWRDIGMEILDGIRPGAFRYTVEYAADPNFSDWKMLIDASENTHDLSIDYRTFEPVAAFGVRLNILGAPEGITPGLVSLTAFGKCRRNNQTDTNSVMGISLP